ncbi:RAMP superfamily CRISPR-associated protein [Marinobacter sp.]|uniref:RAMP superfamily CRISPR-associated protein n=1 Tax=Marinobacter sp. TaxID=50741 RepID=UPI0019E30120|nr:RAMP superfamily CRISPR-associated protein [Marinobacter sp.]MBE0486912.1 hypothetical protein [Marinobacter sp.]
MKTLSYQLSFHTPAFLGNAEQSGQWRTPPFKALLRQWWRVAWMADKDFRGDVRSMRDEEGKLFGHAWLENDSFERDGRMIKTSGRKSEVRLRISHWEQGKLNSWQGLEQGTIFHPESEITRHRVGPHAYLGYGPLDGRGNTKLSQKVSAAIQAGENATFSIAVPEEASALVEQALWLMDRYATAGGRSRNGWGSFSLTPLDDTPALAGELPSRDWQQALQLDWPHAIGSDDYGPLIWQTQAHSDWQTLMRELAIIKIGLRTQLVFNSGNNTQTPEARHWLSHPVTRHNVKPWRQGRLPNSLRFKAYPDSSDPTKLRGHIFHAPALPTDIFRPDKEAVSQAWATVHNLLDELTQKPDQRSYLMIKDPSRRANLKAQLNEVTLGRNRN